MHYTELAWALSDAIDQHLDAQDRVAIYVALGAGDTDGAITAMIRALNGRKVALAADITAALEAWCRAQAPKRAERLRAIIADLDIVRSQPSSFSPPRLSPVRRHRRVRRAGPRSP